MGRWVLRGALVALSVLMGIVIRPPSLSPLDVSGPVAGLAAAAAILATERLLRRSALHRLLGGAVGLLIGTGMAALVLRVAPMAALPDAPAAALRGFVLLLCAYCGIALGSARSERLTPRHLRSAWSDSTGRGDLTILDTSVIIDGRIADISESGFLDAALVVPQFILRELQHIADSQDPLRRNRGRKGLEILQRMKKLPGSRVTISESDFPDIREVDLKLIELARHLGARILTNDFNLNKVAELRGVRVLNINVLANALKPVVLPGETMPVFILKEGKEPNQGVGYLDDGTMVVVDAAKRFLGRTITITVTSVLQTTAGKMLFGRCDGAAEESFPAETRPRRTGA